MSSNTLRGIGQEGDDESEAEAEAETNSGAITGPNLASDTPAPAGQPPAEQPGLSDKDQVPSLDSKIPGTPGTRSLDSSVPGAMPSLDAKVPSLAATLMGVPAPVVDREKGADREKGTVLGRDVHLPAEIKRSAVVRRVAGVGNFANQGDSGATPLLVEGSEPTKADSMVASAVARAAADGTSHKEMGSHAPWYDELPAGDEVYDDPQPNILARVAMGVALAAVLSVLIFGFVRLRGRNAPADEAPASRAALARGATANPTLVSPPSPGGQQGPPLALPSSGPQSPPPQPAGGGSEALAQPSGGLPAGAPVAAAPQTIPPATFDSPPRPRPPAGRLSTSTRPSTGGGGPAGSAGGTRPSTSAVVPADIRAGRLPSRGSDSATVAPGTVRPQIPDSPPAPTTTSSPLPRALPTEKAKSRPAYDPDSTLPLNLE